MSKHNKVEVKYITLEDFEPYETLVIEEVPLYLQFFMIGICCLVWGLAKPVILRIIKYLNRKTYGNNPPPESETCDEGKVDKSDFMWFPGNEFEDQMYYYAPAKRPMAKVRAKKRDFIDKYYKKFQAYCKKNELDFKERYT
jgi:hypothetical protein